MLDDQLLDETRRQFQESIIRTKREQLRDQYGMAENNMDTRNRVRFIETLYIGNVNTSIVRAAEVYSRAVREVLPAILIAHNHPSGRAEPSPEDIAISKTLREVGRLLDVDLLDRVP